MIDIGLDQGHETLAAAESGFTVFAFEPRSESISAVVKSLAAKNISFEIVNLLAWSVTAVPAREAGHVYLFQAAVGMKTRGNVSIS